MSLDVPGRNSKCTEISSLFSAGSAAYAKLLLRQAAVFLTLGREREAARVPPADRGPVRPDPAQYAGGSLAGNDSSELWSVLSQGRRGASRMPSGPADRTRAERLPSPRFPRPLHRTPRADWCNPSQPRFPPRSPDRLGSNVHPACPRDARHAPRSGRRAAGSFPQGVSTIVLPFRSRGLCQWPFAGRSSRSGTWGSPPGKSARAVP